MLHGSLLVVAEPFDGDMWMLVALGAVHAAAIAIFAFEWLTPASYDREVSPNGRAVWGPRRGLGRGLGRGHVWVDRPAMARRLYAPA